MQNIGFLSLKNSGGFMVTLEIVHWSDSTPHTRVKATDYYPIGDTKTVNPGDFGVPDGSFVSLYASVYCGVDNQSSDIYQYAPVSQVTASYVISGTNQDNNLGLLQVG